MYGSLAADSRFAGFRLRVGDFQDFGYSPFSLEISG